MEPLVALGLASNIIQIVDFSGRMLSRTREIYDSPSGTLQIYTDLEHAARNLEELSRDLIEGVPRQGAVAEIENEEDKRKLKSDREEDKARKRLYDENQRKEKKARRELFEEKWRREENVRKERFGETEEKIKKARTELFERTEKETEETLKDCSARTRNREKKSRKERFEETGRQEEKARRKRFEESEKSEKKARVVPIEYADEDQGQEEREDQESRKADAQLFELGAKAKNVCDNIRDAIHRMKSDKPNTKFQSVRQAFRSVWSETELNALESSLDSIRRQTDTALLFSVWKRLEAPELLTLPKAEREILSSIGTFVDKYSSVLDEISMNTKIVSLDSRHSEVRKAVGVDVLTQSSTIDGLEDKMGDLVQSQQKSRFVRLINARLRFVDMPDRFERIPTTFQDTFVWLYRSPESHPESGSSWDDFSEWLGATTSTNIYWITGKPGSGKSTLMKFLYGHNLTRNALRSWSHTRMVFHAGFFFWNSGTHMQMSREGLLQTLLLELTQQILRQEPDSQILEQIFPDRWNEFDEFSGGRSVLTWFELNRSFQLLIADNSRYFFLAIDGLDEFEGEGVEIVDLIIKTSKHPNVKICTASRPWSVFESAFGGRPSLRLESLTRRDIREYVTSKFDANSTFHRQRKEQSSLDLTRDIVDKASGVFFWVSLVVDALLQGLDDGDHPAELQRTLDTLPADLEDLFDKLLHKVDKKYFRQACELIRLMEEHRSPTVLELSYAHDDDIKSAMSAKVQPLTPDEIGNRVESMTRRLKSRCKGFLEVYDRVGTEDEPSLTKGERQRVGFLHRTARDYFRTDNIRNKLLEETSEPPFNPCDCWANAYLWTLKTLEPKENNAVGTTPTFGVRRWYVWTALTWCMEYALRLQSQDSRVRVTYLDEVGRVGLEELQKAWKSGLVVAPQTYTSFLEVTTHLNMTEYSCIKLGTVSKTRARQFLKARQPNADLVNWLDGRQMLLQRQKVKRPSGFRVFEEIMRYQSKSSFDRVFSSKPKLALMDRI